MIIIEMQENDVIREYNLPEERRKTAVEFFDWLVGQGVIVSWEEIR